jgi:aerotaxis receptor
MPRVVFQLLWDYIQAGRPIVAYVKNLAHDGRYYWVVALVTPMAGGYLSVRFKPTSPLRHTVEQLYKDLRAVEASIEDQSHDRKAAITASRSVLDSALRKLGFSDYDEFMRHATKTEMQSREAKVRRTAHSAEVSLAGLDSLSAQAALFRPHGRRAGDALPRARPVCRDQPGSERKVRQRGGYLGVVARIGAERRD